MASIGPIKERTFLALRRITTALGPAIVVPNHKKYIPNAHEFRLMELLEAVADALEAKDPPESPTTPAPVTEPEPEYEPAA